MAQLIEALPGIELPVGDVTAHLAAMLESDSSGTQSAFRASQMNVVLHFGVSVTESEARACFDAAIRFSQRYPCRVIVLCPRDDDTDDLEMRAKLFGQCYIGDTHQEMCYCEAMILSYKSEDYGYLANQVSIWQEGDLPVYHWLHRVPAEQVNRYPSNLLAGAKRVIFDGAVEPEPFRASIDWAEGAEVRDLASARLLAVRQSIGQFLSGYPVEVILAELQGVEVTHAGRYRAEAAHLLEWTRECLAECAARLEAEPSGLAIKLGSCPASQSGCGLQLEFTYADARYFKWSMFTDDAVGEIDADLGNDRELVPTRVQLMSAEHALAEAFFFD